MAEVSAPGQLAMAHWETINRLARRRFPQGALAEEAALFVLEALARDDWQKLSAFTGRSQLSTYVTAVSLRLLEDFGRSRFGRIKPPLWLQRLGGMWLTLFRLLCLERFSPAEAAALIGNRQPGEVEAAERAAYQILGEIPDCGSRRGEPTELDEDALPRETSQPSPQEQQLEAADEQEVFAVLGRLVFGDQQGPDTPRLLARLTATPLHLDPQERLLLSLCFRDGLPVAEAGRMLGFNRHQAHGRLRRLLERIRHHFAAAGLEEELHALVQP